MRTYSPTHASKDCRRRPGNVAVAVAFSLVTLLSCVALAVDGGMMQDRRRNAQAAADAAAMAAANQLYYNWTYYKGKDDGSAASAAQALAAANGYTDGAAGITVTVHIPPESGPLTGADGDAEVIIQYDHDRYFSRVMGTEKVPIRARAVARAKSSIVQDAIIVLDPTKKGSLSSGGNGVQTISGAPIQVNSSDYSAAVFNGTGTIKLVNGSELDIYGSYATPGGGTIQGTVKTGQTPIPDPFAYLSPPDPSTMEVRSEKKFTSKKDVTLQPGVYKGGIDIKDVNVTLEPGIYYMQSGGFNWAGSGSLTGDGVMIYLDPGTNNQMSLSGDPGVSCTLSPPTSGPYQGFTIWQRRDSKQQIQVNGNGSMQITGTFYAAGGELKVTGNGDADDIGSQYVSNLLSTGGNGNFSVSWEAKKSPAVRVVALVE